MTKVNVENINTPQMLGLALKRLRKKAGLSQAELAESVNIRQATVSDLENGKGTIDSLFKIIQALKINMTCSEKSSSSQKGQKTRAQKVIDLLNE